jgi:hypothetical protein
MLAVSVVSLHAVAGLATWHDTAVELEATRIVKLMISPLAGVTSVTQYILDIVSGALTGAATWISV